MSDTEGPPPEKPETDLADIQNPEPPPPERSYAPDMSLDAALVKEARKGKPQNPAQKNARQIMYGAIGVVLLISVLVIYSMQPKKGSMAFGICSTFLELNTPYPETLNYTELEGSNTAVRIYFSNIDPFGEYKHEMIQCTFGPDEKMGMKMTEVERNRRRVDPQLVEKFNLTLPTIMASDPYLVLPPDWKNPLLPD